MPTFARALEQTLHRSLALANERKQEYSTLEHLLFALTEDRDAVDVMRACKVDIQKLQRSLLSYLDTELKHMPSNESEDSKPTAGFQRVIQRAVIHVQSSGREQVTGANVLVAIFAERESHAAFFLTEQDMTRYDAVNYIVHGISKSTPRQPIGISLLSSETDIALEEWFSAVAASAGFGVQIFRKSLAPGDHLPTLLSESLNGLATACIITTNFKKSPIFKALKSKAVASVLADATFIPLVVGTPVRDPPLEDIFQLRLSANDAENICRQIFSALEYHGEFQSFAEMLRSALSKKSTARAAPRRKTGERSEIRD